MVKWFLSSINDVADPLLIACLNFSLRTPCGVNHVFCKRSSGQLVVGDANLPWSLVIISKIIPSCKGTLVANYTGVNLGPQIRCKPIGIRAPLYVSVQDWSYWIPYFLPAWCDLQTMQPIGVCSRSAQVVVFVAGSNLHLRSASTNLLRDNFGNLPYMDVNGNCNCQSFDFGNLWGFVWFWNGMIVEHPMPCMGIQEYSSVGFRVSVHVGCSPIRF